MEILHLKLCDLNLIFKVPKSSKILRQAERLYMTSYTLRNEGSLAALKEPLGFFCVTGGSFDGVGFFRTRKGSLMYPTGPEGSLASSRHRGFFECNTMVGIIRPVCQCLYVFLMNIILAACHIFGTLLN